MRRILGHHFIQVNANCVCNAAFLLIIVPTLRFSIFFRALVIRDKEILMNTCEQRRSFLFGMSGLGLSAVFARGITNSQAAPSQGFALAANEGEALIHFRDHGRIFIKVGAATGSTNLALGTQQVTVGAGIPTHRHLQMDEAFYILEGSGIFTLNDVDHTFDKGATIFIPRNSWHAFANPDHELLLLWIMSPAGLDGFFRETCSPPGAPPKQLTQDQIKSIALKYHTEFR